MPTRATKTNAVVLTGAMTARLRPVAQMESVRPTSSVSKLLDMKTSAAATAPGGLLGDQDGGGVLSWWDSGGRGDPGRHQYQYWRRRVACSATVEGRTLAEGGGVKEAVGRALAAAPEDSWVVTTLALTNIDFGATRTTRAYSV